MNLLNQPMLMKESKRKWILWYSKVLSALMAVLGVVSCGLFRKPQPCMYGVPFDGFKEDSAAQDTAAALENERRIMYGPPVARWEDWDEDAVYEIVEHNAEFPGGAQALAQYIKEHLRYPDEARQKSIDGHRVLVSFVVDKDGTIDSITVLRSLDPLLDEEAVRLVSTMPKWQPATLRGKVVRERYVLPVDFEK